MRQLGTGFRCVIPASHNTDTVPVSGRDSGPARPCARSLRATLGRRGCARPASEGSLDESPSRPEGMTHQKATALSLRRARLRSSLDASVMIIRLRLIAISMINESVKIVMISIKVHRDGLMDEFPPSGDITFSLFYDVICLHKLVNDKIMVAFMSNRISTWNLFHKNFLKIAICYQSIY